MSEFEEALVRSAREGDRAAFDELVRRTSRLVYSRLYLETGDSHRAEDLLQETLLAALRSIRQLADPAGFRAWLLAIAQHTAIDAARRALRQKRTAPAGKSGPAALEAVPSKSPGPEESAQRDEQRRQVLSVLRSMPEEYRMPLTLRYIGGADHENICLQLGLTNGSLRGLLHRGLKQLREELKRVMPEA